jgi:hypothetical protein
MPGTLHELPTDAQQEGITHVLIKRLILAETSINVDVSYGTVDGEGTFQADALGQDQQLRVTDVAEYRSKTFDDNPDTRGAAFDRLEKELALHIDTDSDTKWHTLR